MERDNKEGLATLQAVMHQMSLRLTALSQPDTVAPQIAGHARADSRTRKPCAGSGNVGGSSEEMFHASQPGTSSASSSDPYVGPTPEQLSNAHDPVKSLRRHRPSVNSAAIILKELALLEANNSKKKGGQNCRNANNVNANVEADWPELYVYRLGGTEPTYDSLSLAEFVAGYLSIMEEVTNVCPMNVNLLRHITYLRHLMEDCFLTEWHVVRTAHRHVLNGIEHRRFQWEDTPLVMETKRVALARLQNSSTLSTFQNLQPASTSVLPSSFGLTPPVVCVPYQQLACLFTNDHDVDGVVHMHCCAFCFHHNGCKHTHPQTNCRKAKEALKGRGNNKSKNGAKKE